MFAILLLLLFIAVEVLIFSAPARIPTIRQWVMTHRIKRWVVIGTLSLTVTLFNYIGINWLITAGDIMFAELVGVSCEGCDESSELTFEHRFKLDYKLQGELVNEIALRRIFLRGNEQCFSDNSDVCEVATSWLVRQAEYEAYGSEMTFNTADDYTIGFAIIMIFLSPSVLTGYFVYRITRDNRKQKRG